MPNRPLAPVRIAQIAIICIAILTSSTALPQATGKPTPSSVLPNLGDGVDMTPGIERRLGDRIARELYRDPDYVDDPVIMDYVQAIWQPLLAAARLKGELPVDQDEAYAWQVLLIRDRSVNAFALPGAYLGLHLGLVGVVTNRDELASVLAHELSHVTQRHISRMMARQSAQAPWMLGAMILGILAASKSPDGANAMIVGGQAAAAQTQLNFSRDMEREADRIGFGVMAQAGFQSEGFVTMFEKLQQASRHNDSGGFPYLRSHPLSTERMADMQARMPQPAAATSTIGVAVMKDMDHAMIAARARVISNPAVDALRTWSVEAEPARTSALRPAQQAGALYGATLAAIKLREFDAAQSLWARLAAVTDKDAAAAPLTRFLGAELALARGDGAAAVTLLQTTSRDESRAQRLMVAQANLATGKTVAAVDSLLVWLADHPQDAQAWQLLSGAFAAQGRMLSSVRAEAEAHAVQLDYAGALTRFKAAQDIARKGVHEADHIEASIVDTRARQMDLWLKEQALER